MFNIGDKVKIASDNDSYDKYRGKVLIVTSIATSVSNHPGYDEAMNGMPLYDLKLEDGSFLPFSLYEYEIERD